VTIVGKTGNLHGRDDIRIQLEENMESSATRWFCEAPRRE